MDPPRGGGGLPHSEQAPERAVVEVVIGGPSVVILMEGEATHSRNVSTASTASLKPFYTRPSDFQHPMEDDVEQMAWRADLGSGGHSIKSAPMYTLPDRRRVVSATSIARWGYRGGKNDGEA